MRLMGSHFVLGETIEAALVRAQPHAPRALRYSFDMGALADKLDAAIAAVLASGLRTADIKSEGTTAASTTQMGEAILKELQALHA